MKIKGLLALTLCLLLVLLAGCEWSFSFSWGDDASPSPTPQEQESVLWEGENAQNGGLLLNAAAEFQLEEAGA